jgi:hypothetical protein
MSNNYAQHTLHTARKFHKKTNISQVGEQIGCLLSQNLEVQIICTNTQQKSGTR